MVVKLCTCRILAPMYALTLTQRVAPPKIHACYTFQHVLLGLNAQE